MASSKLHQTDNVEMLAHKLVFNSATGTRTRVARVRAEYPNQLDYSGSRKYTNCARDIIFEIEPHNGEVGCPNCAAETKKAFKR